MAFPAVKNLKAPVDDVKYRVGVSDKAREKLGWSPKYDINYVIDDSVNFVKKNMKWL